MMLGARSNNSPMTAKRIQILGTHGFFGRGCVGGGCNTITRFDQAG